MVTKLENPALDKAVLSVRRRKAWVYCGHVNDAFP